MHNASVLVVCILFFTIVNGGNLKVIHFGKCDKYHDTPSVVTENEFEISDGIHRKTIVGLDLKKNLDNLEARLSIYKCDREGNVDNCVYFWKDHEIKNICEKLSTNDILVRYIIDSTTPKVTSCPMRKGFYETTFLGGHEFFHNFSLATGIWTVKWSLIDQDNEISCYECQVNISGN